MLVSSLVMLFLIFLSAILAASEVALVVISDNKVNIDAEKGNKRAYKVQVFTETPKKYLTTIQVLVTLIALVNGAIALDTFSNDVIRWFDSTNPIVEPLVITIIALMLLVFHVVIGQMIPKRLANKYPNQIAYGTISFITGLTKLSAPVLWILTQLSTLVGRFVGLKPSEGDRKVTEEEIRSIVEESSKTGNIDEEEGEMIQNIFDFSDTTVDEIMTHRTEISALNVKSTKAQILEYVRTEQYTRFPVYENSIDHIIGTLHVKDLLKYIDNTDEKFTIKALLRPPYFIPESKKTSDLFKEMQKQKNHIAVVIDEYGGTAGIVTIEDLIEEIVGNIFDEYDEDDDYIKQIDDRVYEIDGLISINDVEDIIEAGLPVDDYDTLSGFILGQLGRFPMENEEIVIQYNGFKFEVLRTEDKKISKVKVTKPLIEESYIEE
ncbi:MAG: hemolysin family protein [Acholeplasmataceae bacterium]|nr:hemolysin family protein [Acholeplasmataceae bacterium]